MEKKGTHVGVVISFVIFVTFLMFLYAILIPPIEQQNNEKNLLNNLELDFVQNAAVNDLATLTFTLSGNRNHDCVKVTGGTAQDILQNNAELNNLNIKDKDGNSIGYRLQGSQILMGTISQSYNGILKAYYGTGIENSSEYAGSPGCDNVDANTDAITNESGMITDSQIGSLVDEYANTYENIKTQLNIPEANDFWFNFTYANLTSVWPTPIPEIPLTLSVYADTFPVQYINASGDKQIGLLLLKIW